MNRKISRRHILAGLTGLALSPLLLPRLTAASHLPMKAPFLDYPPALTGMRGNHDSSFQHMHSLRDQQLAFTDVNDTSEYYDLVIVGSGISGLAAAYFYSQRTAGHARILLLDNHEDFGGNARRNEFSHNKQTFIGYAGSRVIDSSSLNPAMEDLFSTLNIDFQKLHQAHDQNLYKNLALQKGVFFNRDSFASEKLVRGAPFLGYDKPLIESYEFDAKKFVSEVPLSKQGKAHLLKLLTTQEDYLSTQTILEKKKTLGQISYAEYLRNYVGVSDEVIQYYEHLPLKRGLGASAISARTAMSFGLPGFEGIKPKTEKTPEEKEIYHFPDGNGSISRLIACHLIPGLASDNSMEGIVTEKLDYAKLDRPGQRVRIRLNSTAVKVLSEGEQVSIIYIDDKGLTKSVTANHTVLACPHAVIPYICPELPDLQKKAMKENVRVPVVYANIFVRNWKPFVKAGVSSIYCPGDFFHEVSLNFPVSIGNYRFNKDPEQPAIIHMEHVPYITNSSLTARDHFRSGRYRLLGLSLEDIERHVREQLNNILGEFGFNAGMDILDITINRWAHGASYMHNSLYDDESAQPFLTARKPYGRITIANADAGGSISMDNAVEEAYRAISEL